MAQQAFKAAQCLGCASAAAGVEHGARAPRSSFAARFLLRTFPVFFKALWKTSTHLEAEGETRPGVNTSEQN